MKDTIYKSVTMKEVRDHFVRMVENGEAYTSSGRPLGNIVDPFGRVYTLRLEVTRDEDETFGQELDMPLIPEGVEALVSIPEKVAFEDRPDVYPSAPVLDKESLEFPEE